jgi:flagellar biosynthesis protein FlhB
MADSNGQERNQPASPKREAEFAKRGDTGTSRELATVFVLSASAACLSLLGPGLAEQLSQVMRSSLASIDGLEPRRHLAAALGVGLGGLLPWLLAIAAAGVLAYVVQGRVIFSPEVISPRWQRLDPLARAKEIFFSLRGLAELVKALLKAAVVGGVAAWFIHRDLPLWLGLAHAPLAEQAAVLGGGAVRLVSLTALGLGVIALADLVFTRWDHGRRMMMTQEEARLEHKEQEGDPLLRSRRRQRHRDLSLNRILREVPRADVVVANPTHFAVALRYVQGEDSSPRLTAKGLDHLALRIRSLARQNGVPVIENRPLARALHRKVRVGQSIPARYYRAVAEIYAFLFRRRQGAQR